MKITEAKGEKSRTTAKIDLGLSGLPSNVKTDIQERVGEYLVEQILINVGNAQTPVQGESWPALSKEYKDRKIELGGVGKPNMELDGGMLDSLTFRKTNEGIEIGFFDDQAWKADGHLKFSGEESNLPKRRFIPGEGQNFKTDIAKEVKRIVGEGTLEQFRSTDFRGITSQPELYARLAKMLPGLTRAQQRDFVMGNFRILDILDDLNLLRFL